MASVVPKCTVPILVLFKVNKHLFHCSVKHCHNITVTDSFFFLQKKDIRSCNCNSHKTSALLDHQKQIQVRHKKRVEGGATEERGQGSGGERKRHTRDTTEGLNNISSHYSVQEALEEDTNDDVWGMLYGLTTIRRPKRGFGQV